MIGSGMNPASLMARAALTRSARSALSGNASCTAVQAGICPGQLSSPSSFAVMSREKSANSALYAAAGTDPGTGLVMRVLL